MFTMMENLSVYGMEKNNLYEIQPGYFVDNEIVRDLHSLINDAKLQGFELRVESAYRTFEKQLSIWNRKASGELPLLSSEGIPMERPKDEEELMHAILTWSALPGASRHHLGTDIDVVDGAACPEGYEVQLTPEECSGMFSSFHHFLTERIAQGRAYGFSRVFIPGRGKTRPEEWHIAHLPTSRKRLENFDLKKLRQIYERSEMACKNVVLANLEQLADDYIYPYFI